MKTNDTNEIRRYLVTGGCGMIGRAFISYLLESGRFTDTIVVVDKMSYCSSKPHLDSRVVTYKCNIRNSDFVKHILDQHKITHCIHFAASSHVCRSFQNSIEFTIENVLGTHHLLEECRKYGKLKLFVHISTDECYGDTIGESTEKSLLLPTNGYASSKAGAEMLVHAYLCSYRMPLIVARCNNAVGEYQYPEKLIPGTILRFLKNKPFVAHGNGLQERSFIYLKDISNAVQIIIDRGKIGEIYNIASKFDFTVLEIVNLVAKLMNHKPVILFGPDRGFQDRSYKMNGEKLAALGFQQSENFEEQLIQTIQWYVANPNYWPEFTIPDVDPALYKTANNGRLKSNAISETFLHVCVSGASGYLGSVLTATLLRLKFEVSIMFRPQSDNLGTVEKLKRVADHYGSRLHLLSCNLLHFDEICQAFRGKKFDAVIHFAGVKRLRESYENPIGFHDGNLTPTLNILKAMKIMNCHNLIFASSASVYGDSCKNEVVTETTATKPVNPYGRCKLHIEEILKDAAAGNTRWKIISLRFANPIGCDIVHNLTENTSSGSLQTVLSSLISRKSSSFRIFGEDYATKDGTAVRDLIDVRDCAEAAIKSIERFSKMDNGKYETYNIASGQGISMLQIIDRIEKILATPVNKVFAPRREGDVGFIVLNGENAREHLMFTPAFSLTDTLLDMTKFKETP